MEATITRWWVYTKLPSKKRARHIRNFSAQEESIEFAKKMRTSLGCDCEVFVIGTDSYGKHETKRIYL